jgi:hypothetical protein
MRTWGFGVRCQWSTGVYNRLSASNLLPHFRQFVHSRPYTCAWVGVTVGVNVNSWPPHYD